MRKKRPTLVTDYDRHRMLLRDERPRVSHGATFLSNSIPRIPRSNERDNRINVPYDVRVERKKITTMVFEKRRKKEIVTMLHGVEKNR